MKGGPYLQRKAKKTHKQIDAGQKGSDDWLKPLCDVFNDPDNWFEETPALHNMHSDYETSRKVYLTVDPLTPESAKRYLGQAQTTLVKMIKQ